jgi:protein-S-isoprenylcysteine O-methyltransferase Ste14
MRRPMIFLYGLFCYAIFLGAFLYATGFLANFAVPKSVDSGPPGGTLPTVVIDVLLLSLFALQHSGMARQAFKRWMKHLLPPAAERSTYVLASSLVLILLYWQWRPLQASVWRVGDPTLRQLLWGVYLLGWAIVLFGTFMIDHAHLFGVSQTWAHMQGRESTDPRFQTRWLYRYVRHPLMLGFIIAFWATPAMTAGHLLFAAASTGYIVLATLAFEERDLARLLGEPYRLYRRRVPAFIPHVGRGVTVEEFTPHPDGTNAPRATLDAP